MKKLFKFDFYKGRGGKIDGLFIATQEEVDSVIGKEVGLGDALGKHSDVYGTVEMSAIENVEINNEAVEFLYEKYGSTISGYNPIDYVEEYEDEDE